MDHIITDTIITVNQSDRVIWSFVRQTGVNMLRDVILTSLFVLIYSDAPAQVATFQGRSGRKYGGAQTMNSEKIDKDIVLSVLRSAKPKFQQSYGLIRLGIFGSVVRMDQGPASDVDVVVDLKRQDLFFLIGIKQELEESLRTGVDLVSYRTTMNPFLKRRIDAEAIYV